MDLKLGNYLSNLPLAADATFSLQELDRLAQAALERELTRGEVRRLGDWDLFIATATPLQKIISQARQLRSSQELLTKPRINQKKLNDPE